MKKTKFLAILTGILSSLPFVADAAYPQYNPQQMAAQGYVVNNNQYYGNQYNPQQMAGRTNITPQQLVAASATNGRPMTIGATNPNRVTGALPRVGSSATNAFNS